MKDTSIRVKDETYRSLVRARGAFEHTFGTKLSLDDAMYLAAYYTNLAYGELRNLLREDLVRIAEKDGEYSLRFGVKLSGPYEIARNEISKNEIAQKALSRVIASFQNFRAILEAREH
jgi:hypothetical protein